MTTKEEVLRLCDEVGIYKTYDDAAGAEVWVADLRELTELIELAKEQGSAEERERARKILRDAGMYYSKSMKLSVTEKGKSDE